MRRQRGLTLVELLIVIAIIAALAGLLFPIFVTIRERARITYCINSLKQVGNALHMYAQDHDGFAPPYTNGPVDPIKHFPNANDPALFETAYAPYSKDKQIWYCPLDPFAGENTPEGPPDWAVGYSPTWAAFYWNTVNHKATSYGIPNECALKAFAPIRVDDPPTYGQIWRHYGYSHSDVNPDEHLHYALDFTHGHPCGPWAGIRLSFDGSVSVRFTRR